jgi:hypothetical protein
LTGDRVIDGTPLSTSTDNTRIFLDPATGADVRHTSNGVIQIVNTNASDALEVNGISVHGNSSPAAMEPESENIPAGGDAQCFNNAVNPFYLDLAVLRVPGSGVSGVALLHLTCGVSQGGQGQMDCIGVH